MPDPSSSSFRYYNRLEYFHDLCARINQADSDSHILVASMSFYPDEPVIGTIVDALLTAAQRGATVSLIVDAYDYLVDEHMGFGPLWYHSTLPTKLQPHDAYRQQTLQRLRQAGVSCVMTNLPNRAFSNPFAGRSHIKTAIIDDYVYIGGCNLGQPEMIDVMVGWHDCRTANWLYQQMQKVMVHAYTVQALGPDDLTFDIDTTSQLILDCGVRKQSLIMHNALEVIDAAQDWLVITSQYLPDQAAKHLSAALRRGVKVYSIFNNYSQYSGVNHLAQQTIKHWARLRRPAALFQYELASDLPYLHAKVLASEKEAMIGSHNYLRLGVTFGTAELSLRRKDPVFARKLADFTLLQTGLEKTIALPRNSLDSES